MLQKEINTYWKHLEKNYPEPTFVKKVKDLDFQKLKKAIDKKDKRFVKRIIKNMYVNKEAFILKRSASKSLKKIIIDLANHYKSKKSTFITGTLKLS